MRLDLPSYFSPQHHIGKSTYILKVLPKYKLARHLLSNWSEHPTVTFLLYFTLQHDRGKSTFIN
jgi:hypothetical protein